MILFSYGHRDTDDDDLLHAPLVERMNTKLESISLSYIFLSIQKEPIFITSINSLLELNMLC